jgi:hypothetical protein
MAKANMIGGALQGLKNLMINPKKTMLQSLAPKKTMAIGRGLLTHPGKTLAKGWAKSSLFDKAIIGAAVLPDAMSMARPSQPGQPGKSEVAGRMLGTMAGGIAFNRAPLLGSLIGWTAGSTAGGMAGKAFGKTTGIGKAQKLPEGEPSLASKLYKTGEDKKLRSFAKRRIKEIEDKEKARYGDVAAATFRDPTGTYDRTSTTETNPHA